MTDTVPAACTGEKRPTSRGIGAGAAVLAFDVGGTDIKAALFDSEGTTVGLQRTQTPALGDESAALLGDEPAAVLIDELARLADGLRAQHPDVVPAALGFVVPGMSMRMPESEPLPAATLPRPALRRKAPAT